jgi:hypothetical protein
MKLMMLHSLDGGVLQATPCSLAGDASERKKQATGYQFAIVAYFWHLSQLKSKLP